MRRSNDAPRTTRDHPHLPLGPNRFSLRLALIFQAISSSHGCLVGENRIGSLCTSLLEEVCPLTLQAVGNIYNNENENDPETQVQA